MTWMNRIPRSLWGSAAIAFLVCGSLLPLMVWRLELPRRLPASLVWPATGLALVATVSWLGAGSYCLARSRRRRAQVHAEEHRISLAVLPHAHLR